MSSTAASSRPASRSTSASAPFRVPTGPTTAAHWLSRKCARSLASVYSSSTTRIVLPASAADADLASGMAILLQLHADRAAHAVGLEPQAGLGAELVGQGALDQLAAVAVAPRPVGRGHGDAALLPLDHRPAFAVAPLDPPADRQPSAGLGKRAVLGGVGCQLVQRQPERL